MELSALLGMIAICGTVIGGFIYFLLVAVRKKE